MTISIQAPSATGNSFFVRIAELQQERGSLLCIGLDPDPSRMPKMLRAEGILSGKGAIFNFNKAIIDATHDLVCCYKPQIAHYAAHRAEDQLEQTIDYIHDKGLPVLLDAKRGDVGSTAEMYARELFERYGADAVTVNPWLGHDAMQPFLDRKDKGVFVLCRTSNPGGADLQHQPLADGNIMYERVARLAAEKWNHNGNVGLVVGATAPDELRRVREICPDMMFLVPGVGAQGGDIGAMMAAGQGGGMLISSSRAIIYAGDGKDFDKKDFDKKDFAQKDFSQRAREAAEATRDAINRHRQD